MEDMFDLEQLALLVPVQLHRSAGNSSAPALREEDGAVTVRGEMRSEKVREEYPCAKAPLLRRVVDSFWFSQCTRHVVNSGPMMGRLNQLLGAPPGAKRPLNVLLRSGLFYSAKIKSAVQRVRRGIGGEYFSLHVRRSDKLTACSPEDCKRRDEATRPPAIERALGLWFPEQSRVYIGSTEKPAFFAPLRKKYKLFFAEDFGVALANVTNNYMLYAVETLVFFGSSGESRGVV